MKFSNRGVASGMGARCLTRVIASSLCLVAFAQAADVPRATPVKGGAGIALEITLSVDPPNPAMGYDFCGPGSDVVAFTGENVRWCFEITNNTGQNLTRHDLMSSGFGNILTAFPFTLAPGASAFLTQVEPVTGSREEMATWTAFNPGPVDVHSDTDVGSLTAQPGIELEITLSIDPEVLPPNYDFCGTETDLLVPPGRNVRWCYSIRNLSSIDRTRHTLESPRLGTILNDFPFTLAPAASAFLTQVETMGESDITESAAWTAFQPGPTHVSEVGASAVARGAVGVFYDGFE